MKKLTPAVGYMRMSDKKQDKSIAAQKHEIERFAAANGYRVIRWYADEGISGWKNDREAFQCLIADSDKGDFQAVLCWDQDRFSRFDPMEANYYWYILRRAGVVIVTVGQGQLDFETLGGWLTASINQHGKSEYSRELSRNVLRGRLAKALRGKWQQNRPPYGYKIVNNGDLVPDQDAAPIVKRIFKRYATADCSLWDIAHELNSDGVPGPRGGIWKASSVRQILRRDTYAMGKARQLRNPKGRFFSVVNGEIVPSGKRKLDCGEGMEIVCSPLISVAVWEKTQQNLRRRQKGTTPGKSGKGAVLIGLMHCANCGGKMYAGDRARGKNASVTDRVYWCSTYHHRGRHCCTRNLIHEAAILDYLIPRLQAALLSPANIDKFAQSLRRSSKSRQAPTDTSLQRKRLSALEQDLAAAVRELKRAPDDVYDLAVADLRAIRKERDDLQSAIEQSETQAKSGESPHEAIQAALERSQALGAALLSADRKTVRHAMGELIERIDLWFEPVPGKKIVRSAFVRGSAFLRPVSQLVHPASPTAQLGRMVELVFAAFDLAPVQFDPRSTPGVDAGVVFLRDYLASGRKRSRDAEAAGERAGISRSTIRKSARRLGVVFDRSGWWSLAK